MNGTAPNDPDYHWNVEQGTPEWLQLRCGRLTASEIKLIMTPSGKIADNEKTRAHVYRIAHQRMTRFVPPHFVSFDMLRGQEDEILARDLYAENTGPVRQCGFITSDRWGFTIGYSPDGLVGGDGLIECKSRREDLQTEYIIEDYSAGRVPAEHVLQVQTGLMVTRRKWLDFISYSNGEPMTVVRVYPDFDMQDRIIAAAQAFEKKVVEKIAAYTNALNLREPGRWSIPTERREVQEMFTT